MLLEKVMPKATALTEMLLYACLLCLMYNNQKKKFYLDLYFRFIDLVAAPCCILVVSLVFIVITIWFL